MAADRVPADDDLERGGRQLNARESREPAERPGAVQGGARSTPTDREVPTPGVGGLADDPRAYGASGGVGNDALIERAPDERAFADSETALGGADSVQKTTWGVGMGGEPDGRLEQAPVGLRKGEGTVVARSSAGGGVNPIAWIVGLLAVAAALIYGFGALGG